MENEGRVSSARAPTLKCRTIADNISPSNQCSSSLYDQPLKGTDYGMEDMEVWCTTLSTARSLVCEVTTWRDLAPSYVLPLYKGAVEGG